MIGRGVIHHDINHQFHITSLQTFQQFVKILHRPIIRINSVIVRYVISIIMLRGYIYRLQPHNIDTQMLQIIKLLG
ncbi:hypothetical protein D3C76_1553910 [compost metagenome]